MKMVALSLRLPRTLKGYAVLSLVVVTSILVLFALGVVLSYGLAVNRLSRGIGQTMFYGADGSAWFPLEEHRRDVPMSRISGYLRDAVVAIEDHRFQTHPGLDPIGIGRAIFRDIKARRLEEGGSTLTQQLARILVTGSERSAERKLRELLYAVEMEQTLGKPRILQLYLDNAPWGPDGLCGAEAAAKRYFKRPALKLDPAQSVWLAAMLHNPAAELEKWQRTGQIDLARAKWVAEGIRGVPRAQRESVQKAVEKAKFAPPA